MKVLIRGAVGALIGFGVGYFGRCASGTCPMTSNPWVSAVIGAIFGCMILAGR